MTAQQSSPLSQAATDTVKLSAAELRAVQDACLFVRRNPSMWTDWRIILEHYRRFLGTGEAAGAANENRREGVAGASL